MESVRVLSIEFTGWNLRKPEDTIILIMSDKRFSLLAPTAENEHSHSVKW